MAAVEDLPEYLRPLASRVPAETREHMSARELTIRCEEAAGLMAQAEMQDEDRARRCRRDAEKILTAVSFRAFIVTLAMLTRELEAARKQNGQYAVMAVERRIQDLAKNNPQADRVFSEFAGELGSQTAAKRRWFRKRG
jgi:hypothetical protein